MHWVDKISPDVSISVAWLLAAVLLAPTPSLAEDCGSDEPERAPDRSLLDAVAKWDGVEVYSGPGRRGDPIRVLSFGTTFRVYNERAEWFCLGSAEDGKFVGWASRTELLTKRDGVKDKKTGIYIKVMVRNSLEAKRDSVFGKFWTHPKRRNVERREAGIYEVRYVFDIETYSDGGRQKYVYLTGTGQEWNIDNADQMLDGWISEDFVFVWKTRVGVQYRDGISEQVKIYPDREDVDAVFCNGENRDWAFSSLEDDMNWPYDRERFPVISEGEGAGCLGKRRVLEIGAFGTVVLNKKELTASQGDHIVSTMSGLRGGNQNIDVLLVIDGTESMQPAFVEAKKAVERVKDKGALADAQYSLVMFKDRKTKWPPRMTARPYDATAIMRELERFMQEVGKDVNDSDLAESVLDGVLFGLEQMESRNFWRENSARALILVGDHGDHSDAGHQGRLDNVLSALQRQKVRFFAYQTVNTRSDADTTYRRFQSDGQLLIEKMTKLFPKKVAIAHGDSEKIANALTEMRSWRRRVDEGYEAIRNGEVPPSEVGPYIQSMLASSGFTLEQVMGYGRAPQVCHKGFTLLGGDDFFEKRIRISYKDVARLTVAFRDFLADTSSPKNCLRSMTTAFQAATGDTPRENESPEDFLERTLGIKVRSELLELTFTDLSNTLANSRARRDELRAELDRSVALLDAVYREEEVTVDGHQVELVYEDDRVAKRDWFKTLQDDTRVAWIPTDYIP